MTVSTAPEPFAETPAALRVLAADDELVARKRLVRLLSAMPGVELLDCHAEAETVLRAVQTQTVDVLVLDIQMPGLTGLELKAMLGDDGPFVVFATAHPEHAVEAFEVGAVDYVLKPIEAGRLGKAIGRAREARAPAAESSATGFVARIPVTTREGIVLLDPDAVSHAIFDGSLVTLCTVTGAAHLSEATLQDLQARLPADRFERVHRRALLNLAQVEMLRPTDAGGYVARMRGGGDVPVSRQAARKLRRWLGITRA
jgi:two-component system, LytTR family, response regulator